MIKDLNFPSDIGNLRLVEKAIDELSLELDLSDEVYGNVLVATMEATNNAIIHGNRSNPEKEVKIKMLIEDKELKVHVEDQGDGFDHLNIPDPTAPENIEKINAMADRAFSPPESRCGRLSPNLERSTAARACSTRLSICCRGRDRFSGPKAASSYTVSPTI